MAALLRLEIVTPEGRACSEEVEMVTLPGSEGEMGVYPQHVPLMSQIVPGEVRFRQQGQEYFLAVGPGFVEITGERVTILTDLAIAADEADEAKIEAARQAAERRLTERLGEAEAAAVNAAVLHTVEQLRGRRQRRK